MYRYTRGVLPGHFVYDIPAQTHEGQVLWADAVYLRIWRRRDEERWAMRLSAEQTLKLICLFEIFGLPGCAGELVLMKKRELGG